MKFQKKKDDGGDPPEKEKPFRRAEDEKRQVDPRAKRRGLRWKTNSKRDHPREPDGGSAYND